MVGFNVQDGTSMKLCVSSSKILTSDAGVSALRNDLLIKTVGVLNWVSSGVSGSLETPMQDNVVGSDNAHLQGTKVKHEMSHEFDDSIGWQKEEECCCQEPDLEPSSMKTTCALDTSFKAPDERQGQ